MSHTPLYQEALGSHHQLQLSNSESEIELQGYGNSLIDNHDIEHDGTASGFDRLVQTPTTNAQTTRWEQGFWTQFPVLGLLAAFRSLCEYIEKGPCLDPSLICVANVQVL
jgi:hypothetical protein